MTTDAPSSDTLAPNSRAILADLYVQLPKSADEPEAAIAARARKGLDAVIALRPDDAFEARLATRIVAMDAHAADALAAASLAAGDPDKLRQCRAQAASMARQSDSALRTLRRMQAERDKAYNAMHPAAMERAGYWFKYGTSNFNILGGHSSLDPKHCPEVGLRGPNAPQAREGACWD